MLQDIQKIIKKKKLDRKRQKKTKVVVKRTLTDGKFSDKFSDITKTTDDSGMSVMSDDRESQTGAGMKDNMEQGWLITTFLLR